jgi:hypothetical protein
MTLTKPTLLVVAVVSWLALPASAGAGIVTFLGTDFGVAPGAPRPHSVAAASQFLAASQLIGNPRLINFEGLPTNLPLADGVPQTVAPGVSYTLRGTDHTPPAGFSYGLSVNPDDVLTGYNTTPGGDEHLKFAPELGVGTATVDFNFQTPIQALGLFLTGLGTANGNLHVVFNDGVDHDLPIAGSPAGGILYFGFTDLGAQIRKVSFQLRNVLGSSRDVFGIDDVSITVIPEPSASVLFGIGAVGLVLGRRFWRGKRRPASGRSRASAP